MLECIEWVPDGFYWSYGSHPELKFHCRVWRRLKTFPRIEIYIGTGNSLNEAILDCREKYEKRTC